MANRYFSLHILNGRSTLIIENLHGDTTCVRTTIHSRNGLSLHR